MGFYAAGGFGAKKGGVDELGKLRNGAIAEWSNFDLLISSLFWAKPRPPQAALDCCFSLCATIVFENAKNGLKTV